MIATLLAVAVIGACGGGGSSAHQTAKTTQAAPVQPSPSERLPSDPAALAARLTEVSNALDQSIDGWLGRGAVPDPLTFQALYVQRAYRLLARRPRLASLTLARLPATLRRGATDSVIALRDLMRLTPPSHRHHFKTGAAAPATRLLGFYKAAQQRFGVAWNVLASVNFVETDFNRIRSASSAGAQGPMQFIPSTWRVYGLGGDIHDPHDAILGAANYLHRSGAPGSYRHALFAYNPSQLYVDAVLRYAREMASDRRAFYGYYAWQLFVRTPSGDRRLTGP
jgi:hypothetical protein